MTRYDGVGFRNTGPCASDGDPQCTYCANRDCELGINCYDGHDGIDLHALLHTDVYAADDGSVTTGTSSIGGKWLKVWNATLGYSTYYGHLSDYVVASGSVLKSQLIAHSGNTGPPGTPAHLHFGIYDAARHPLDPYGWIGNGQPNLTTSNPGDVYGSDPWGYDRGYLWSESPPTYTPSIPLPSVQVSGTISQDVTWVRGQVYVIQSTVTIGPGITVTVRPGAIVKFRPNTGLFVAPGARLFAAGTAGNPIWFTSVANDVVGGDTNGDGTATIPCEGDFAGITFQNNSVGDLAWSVFDYGGCMSNAGGSLTISHSTFHNNCSISAVVHHITQSGGALQVDACAFDGAESCNVICSLSALPGIEVAGGLATLSNTAFQCVVSVGADVDLSASGNVFLLINWRGYTRFGNIASSVTWTPLDYPYLIESSSSNVQVAQAGSLTLVPGVIVKSRGWGQDFDVYGALLMQGTPSDRVIVTGLNDDSAGGDTNGDGNTQPLPGDCGTAIRMWPGSNVTASCSDYRYGGCPFFGNPNPVPQIINQGGALVLTHVAITNGSGDGISQTAGTTRISRSVVMNHGLDGVRNAGSHSVSAIYNWWGDASGPYNASSNPNGTGDELSDNVTFVPWLTSPP
ncbi:MAG TPA: M23 family metallopeptidase [Planctomycetota bacterium]|jgi:hypothetical protein|nr:M23 family metallopeptidase [Planctomycetota bacterium]